MGDYVSFMILFFYTFFNVIKISLIFAFNVIPAIFRLLGSDGTIRGRLLV